MKDLFGNDMADQDAKPRPRAYPAMPGSGPAGETCKTCSLRRAKETGSMKRYYKCRLVQPTSGGATDIRLKSPACKFWTNKPVESAKDFIRAHLGTECEKREIRR